MTSAPTTVFTGSEIVLLARAISRAPSVHNTQPWSLRVRGADIDLLESDVALPSHDPDGRDRAVSCGAALAHLALAARVLGREPSTTFPADGDVVATVHTAPGGGARADEAARYHAIPRRRSHRQWFAPEPVSDADRTAVASAGAEAGVRLVVPGHLDALAAMLGFATRVFRADPAYQRELDMWTARTFVPHALGAADGIPEDALSGESLPAAGVIRRDTPVPDDARLAKRLESESLLVICTDGDTRRDDLAAGVALERAWLQATVRALAASVITQPLHLLGFRELLAERLELPGVPQAIFRFGHPATPATPAPRLPLDELFPDAPSGGLS
ncbi:Acg family FMN-binding oxidoreductase [Amycolatopsis sp. CA-161197]|uniref:Acg family FMN-binding oxidoreductase n=1 Tax=Amycolatopsis sp. CA-161197 TaxID=3239922 RepID=UPI003D929436